MGKTKVLEVAQGLPANEYLAMRSTGPFYVVEGKYGPYFYDATQKREMNLIDVVLTLNHYFHELAKWNKLEGMLIYCGEQECRDVKGCPEKLRALIDGLITTRAERARLYELLERSYEILENVAIADSGDAEQDEFERETFEDVKKELGK